ncbi:MAG TPA: hypothetical protein VL754_01955 [Verrucomicrobiae bacterium]|nr:hypothetical protein [Verrucomicrobiae bacterium]
MKADDLPVADKYGLRFTRERFIRGGFADDFFLAGRTGLMTGELDDALPRGQFKPKDSAAVAAFKRPFLRIHRKPRLSGRRLDSNACLRWWAVTMTIATQRLLSSRRANGDKNFLISGIQMPARGFSKNGKRDVRFITSATKRTNQNLIYIGINLTCLPFSLNNPPSA